MIKINPVIVHILLSLVLLGIAIGVHVHASSLSLPISPAVSILTILLPVSGFLINMFYSRHGPVSSSSSNRIAKLAPLIVQVLQGLATTILATILFETILPSSTLDCVLETQWMRMFRAHDAGGIQSIQDAYDCCGLNTVKDRAYPFTPGKAKTCAERYERDVACKGPWRGALQKTSGVDLIIVIVVGLMQDKMICLALVKDGMSSWNTWGKYHRGQTEDHHESRRSLLPGPERSIVEEDETPSERSYKGKGAQGYGSLTENGSGSRVIPSSLPEHNNWSD
ncbi:hypothetical protein CEP51_000870 [Fusarium floridanum]|uniref:Tetraspanin n=1 Tax=Fusarium floridanum TaxID=1325733 RepID=A0A428SKB4_9HYPO|nr:hypothetical protein CEP51_000870 [Fusarium floridanum]